MKLFKFMGVAVFAITMGLGSNVQAVSITGSVIPINGYNVSSDKTGTVLFSFTNVDDGAGLVAQAIILTLEGDVFDFSGTAINAPAGWQVQSNLTGVVRLDAVFGSEISTGETLQFTMNFALLEDNAFILDDQGAWSEGGPWQIGLGVRQICG